MIALFKFVIKFAVENVVCWEFVITVTRNASVTGFMCEESQVLLLLVTNNIN